MLRKRSHIFAGFFITLLFVAGNAAAGENTPKRNKRRPPVDIKITAWGPTQSEVDAAIARVERSGAVQAQLKGSKYRLLEFAYIESENKSTSTKSPTRFRVAFYDYTNDRSIVAESDFAGKENVIVRKEYRNPTPNDAEFDEAVSILQKDQRYSSKLTAGSIKTFQPMPPTTILDGTMERLVNIGLRVSNSDQTEVISVSIRRGEVIRYTENAPPSSKASDGSCGIASAGQSTTPQNTPGQYQLTVNDGQNPLWEMLIIRPSASSGTNKSGIEVRDVKYRGKSVLKRGHVPVLNVQYTPASCGPYRDWQWQEDNFSTPSNSTDPAPGIRLVPPGGVATTSIETGVDGGNFRGVAVYQQDVGNGVEVVLITEMQAGWYRYINEWRFGSDGTIRPRYGFGATINGCVCDVHHHHAYWRFDFDIVGTNNRVYQIERGRKFLQPIDTEITRNKNVATNRSLLIQNSTGNEAYALVPNKTDGVVDTFGVNDFWVLRYKNLTVPAGANPNFVNEIDDGETCINCTDTTGPIRIDPFINGESVIDHDVVVWYGAHFTHNDGGNLVNPNRSPEVISGSHVIGPDLRPVRW